MKLCEAYEKLSSLSGIPFGKLFDKEEFKTILINKGKTGQLLEMALGLELSSSNLDFEDGELKTNKCTSDGGPLETVFVTQICNIIDELLQKKRFEETRIYYKIRNILYVPVCKVGVPENWMFLPSIHIDMENPKFYSLFKIWETDYYDICKMLNEHIKNSDDGYIHTSNGRHLQIRSKDAKDKSGKYHPIFSHIYGRYISNKNHAFYFKKQFVYDIKSINSST